MAVLIGPYSLLYFTAVLMGPATWKLGQHEAGLNPRPLGYEQAARRRTRPGLSLKPVFASADDANAVPACLTKFGAFRGVLVTIPVSRPADPIS